MAPGALVRVWLPVAHDSDAQQVKIRRIDAPEGYSFHSEPKYGNRILYFEKEIPAALGRRGDEIGFSINYDVDRREFAGLGGTVDPDAVDAETQSVFLQANRMVPIDGAPARLSASWALPSETLDRARGIYDGVLDHMEYDKRSGYGRGDARWACQSGYGNCSDFHSLFISIARQHGVPAKFEIGFPIPDDRRSGPIKGYHCWASFYVPRAGWVPVDISEGDKYPELSDYYFGTLSENRVGFTVGRDLELVPPQHGEPLNYFIYPYVEVDGVRCDSSLVKTQFRFADHSAK